MRHWMVPSVLAGIVIVGVVGCSSVAPQGEKAEKAAKSPKAEKKEAPASSMTLSQVPEPVQATIKKLTATGKIKKIEKAEEDGKTVYDVEATVQGRDVEYDIAADGTMLTTEQSVPYASLPLGVRNAAQKYFGSVAGLKASVEVEGGKTFYEVEGKKGKALKLSDTGQIVEEEKQ
jgi:uncharacterized membrane protein YkoI